MVQAQQKKHELNGSELSAKYHAIVQDVDSLPPEMLADLVRHIMDTISRQLSIGRGSNRGRERKRENGHGTEARLVEQQRLPNALRPERDRGTLEEALGYLATDKPAPTDEEVERILNERVMERYTRS